VNSIGSWWALKRNRNETSSTRCPRASRSGIEQAKGMLMLIYDSNDNAAFNLLKWLSQEAIVKLRLLAEQISEDFRGAGLISSARNRSSTTCC
jgi:AmiR/NasT family two-component response regulator